MDQEYSALLGRIKYKSTRRGMRELEMVMSSFYEKVARHFNEQELSAFDKVLDITDTELFDMLSNAEQPGDPILRALYNFVRKTNVT